MSKDNTPTPKPEISTSKRGGPRKGAGRKPKAQVHAGAIKRAEKKIADQLPDLIDNLLKLAHGGFITPEDTYEPAGLQTRETTTILTDARGGEKAAKSVEPLYPDKEPDELVLVKRTYKVASPDRGANEYLINRIMGTPTTKHEFAGMTDAEILEEATRAFSGNDSSGDEAPEPD